MSKYEAHLVSDEGAVDAMSFFDDYGNLVSISFHQSNGANVVLSGAFFSTLVGKIASVVKEKTASLAQNRLEAELAQTAEDDKHRPTNPHKLSTLTNEHNQFLGQRCEECGLSETAVAHVVRASQEGRYSTLAFSECAGAPEATPTQVEEKKE